MIKRYEPRKRPPGLSDSEQYDVGYGKPPLHTRFKPGQSGNPKGRHKGLRNFRTEIQEALRSPITVTMGGKTRRISTQLAGVLKLIKRALDGDPRALALFLGLAQSYNNEDPASVTEASDGDLRLLAVFEDRVRRGAMEAFAATQADERSNVSGDHAAREPGQPTPQRSPLKRVRSRRPTPGST